MFIFISFIFFSLFYHWWWSKDYHHCVASGNNYCGINVHWLRDTEDSGGGDLYREYRRNAVATRYGSIMLLLVRLIAAILRTWVTRPPLPWRLALKLGYHLLWWFVERVTN